MSDSPSATVSAADKVKQFPMGPGIYLMKDAQRRDPRWKWLRPCLFASINQCTAPCNLRIDRATYRADIRRLQSFLDGKKHFLLKKMNEEMRTCPCQSVPSEKKAATDAGKSGRQSNTRHVDGKWTLDKTFNGQSATTPDGVIYLITGAGCQHLYNPEQQDDPVSPGKNLPTSTFLRFIR